MRAVLATALLGAGPSYAVNPEGHDAAYAIVGGVYELGDSARDSDDGNGFSVGLGLPLEAREGEALEFSLKAITRDRDAGGRDDQRSLFGHWVRDIGSDWIGGTRPFVLIGLGAVQEDVQGDDHFHAGLDGGFGALFELPFRGWAVRAEAVAQAQLNEKSAPDQNVLLDYHLGLGLQIPLEFGAVSASQSEPQVEPAPECPTRVVDPVTGRTDCISDSDHDGVADGQDQCPATPAGTAVDAVGCTIVGVVDADGDGVVDPADACPESIAGLVVDATGCLVEQTVTLRSVNFETGSARLTPDARISLNEVARTLKLQQNLHVEIVGHTDDAGNDSFNLALSQQRAESVRQYLIGKGVQPERLAAIGMGETSPVSANGTEEGRIANRRVEFKVTVR